jgi:FKBP-type peptidyl-prolyl cis-trans isomerase FklB
MKNYIIIAAIFLALIRGADAQGHLNDAGASPFKDKRSKASYAFGMNLGRGWKAGQVDLDPDRVAQGLQASLAGGATLLTEVEMAEVLGQFGQKLCAVQQHRSSQPAEKDLQPGKLQPSTIKTPFKNERDCTSYAFGMDTGRAWKAAQMDLDPAAVVCGLKDVVVGGASLLSEAEMAEALAQFGREQRILQQLHREQVAQDNLRLGEAFLAQNKTCPDIVNLPSGLQYKILARGQGPSPELTNWVKVKYVGLRIDGTVFERSDAHPEAGIFGLGSITQGWAEALQMMKPGDRWRLFVPPSLAYGREGSPGIGPNETLIYDLELVSILPGQPPPTAEDIANERGPDGD